MDSEYQNCLSDFDLNILDQIINANQQTSLVQGSETLKHDLIRLRHQMKDNSKAMYKANLINELYLSTKNDLISITQQLKDTKNLLFEKNEQYKVICDEQNKYRQQAMEYKVEVHKYEERLKTLPDLEYDFKLKDEKIVGFIDQKKALQTKLDNLRHDNRLKEKNASLVLKKTKANHAALEKNLTRLLKEYVVPKIKKRDKWLESLLKEYVLESYKEDGSNKIGEQDEAGDNHGDSSLKEEFSKSNLNRNSRGSSLALSNGGNSFHSGLPFVTNICNKHNVFKSDASTSPIPQEETGIADNAANRYNEPILVSKKDVCTSP